MTGTSGKCLVLVYRTISGTFTFKLSTMSSHLTCTSGNCPVHFHELQDNHLYHFLWISGTRWAGNILQNTSKMRCIGQLDKIFDCPSWQVKTESLTLTLDFVLFLVLSFCLLQLLTE